MRGWLIGGHVKQPGKYVRGSQRLRPVGSDYWCMSGVIGLRAMSVGSGWRWIEASFTVTRAPVFTH